MYASDATQIPVSKNMVQNHTHTMGSIQERVDNCYNTEPRYRQIYAGVPERYQDIRTVGDLLDISYKVVNVREQLRQNLSYMMRNNKDPYDDIVGFDEDVKPAINRAILAGHDMILVGQMGQAKTKIADIIASRLLSPMPILRDTITNDIPMDLPPKRLAALLEGSDINDTPNFDISPDGAKMLKDNGVDTPIRWADGQERSRFVVATPDMSAKDLYGYVDVAKMARANSDMYDIKSYSPGHLMQARHGILCIDELPVLDPRKQVALLSVLQEGRFMAGAYPVTFRPNILLVCTANPVDYTHTGRIIEPLRDRLRSIIYTRYPDTVQDEMDIIYQEASIPKCVIPDIILRLLAEMVRNVRNNPMVNQDKGVSVRFGIHGLELLVAEAARVRPNDIPCPRPSDFGCLIQAARFELIEIDDTIPNRIKTWQDIMNQTMADVCADIMPDAASNDAIKMEFADKEFAVSQTTPWESYAAQLDAFPLLYHIMDQMDKSPVVARAGTKSTRADQEIDKIIKELKGENHEIRTGPVSLEMTLECLSRCKPPILDRRDSKYAAA